MRPSGCETTSHVHILGLPWSPAFLLQYKVDFAAPLGSKQWSSLKASYWTWATELQRKQHPHQRRLKLSSFCQILSILDLKNFTVQIQFSKIREWLTHLCHRHHLPRPRTQPKVASTKQNFDLTNQTDALWTVLDGFPHKMDWQALKGFFAKQSYNRCWWFLHSLMVPNFRKTPRSICRFQYSKASLSYTPHDIESYWICVKEMVASASTPQITPFQKPFGESAASRRPSHASWANNYPWPPWTRWLQQRQIQLWLKTWQVKYR